MSVCGWCVGGECGSGGERSYLGLLPDEEEVCNRDRERVSIHGDLICGAIVSVSHNVCSLVTGVH